MNIFKITLFALLALFSMGCLTNKKIRPIAEFTTKLEKELDKFSMLVNPKTDISYWPGGNFVNSGNHFNCQINQLGFKKSALKYFGNIVAAPVIANNKLFVLDSSNRLICYDLEKEHTLWVKNLNTIGAKKTIQMGGITLDEDRLYVINGSRDLSIIELSSGNEIARIKLDDIIITPVGVDATSLYVLMRNNQVVSINKSSCANQWNISGPQTSIALLLQSFTQPMVFGNAVFSELYSGQMVLLSKEKGQPIWQINMNQETMNHFGDMDYANLTTQPVIYEHYLFTANGNGQLAKYDIRSGANIWRKKAEDVLGMQKFGNSLIITNNAQQIARLCAESGKVAWVQNLDALDKKKKVYNLLTPIMLDDQIYVVTSDGKMYQLDLQGNIVKIHSIAKDVNFYAVNQGKMYLFAKGGVFINAIK